MQQWKGEREQQEEGRKGWIWMRKTRNGTGHFCKKRKGAGVGDNFAYSRVPACVALAD